MRARIARLLLGDQQICEQIGGITLKPHQQSAAARAGSSLEEFGGVLLCDDVGMGKTFVAISIARHFSRRLVVAPAALASMWRDALATTRTTADFLTFERLSRANQAAVARSGYDLVIVDEAHHARNAAARRFKCLAALARDARILLLTATPIHNRTTEMLCMLSLFLGSRARTLTANELARCVVRREHGESTHGIEIPEIVSPRHRRISDEARIVEEIMNLPPPLPVRDGGLGGALIGRGLVHQWASSEAALCGAIRRRIAKATALAASLESGNYPTARELETWTYGDGALQLGFPELLSSPTEDARALLDAVRSHSDGLREFHARHRADTALDDQRSAILAEIREAHPSGRIVAFAQYADTISMLFNQLAPSGRVAMLTARGGLVSGGKVTRDETLARFAPRASGAKAPSPASRIDLLLATDLLSEGVNLQDADVVVHLDLPWTAARMEQRVGRSARMGSLHSRVHVYLIRPPASAEALLGSVLVVQKKWNLAKRAIGTKGRAPFAPDRDIGEDHIPQSVCTKTERLRRILESWQSPLPAGEISDVCVASVRAPHSGFVAAVRVGGKPVLLASICGCVSEDVGDHITACLPCAGEDVAHNARDYETAVSQLQVWYQSHLASVSAGVSGSRSAVARRLLSRIDSAIEGAPPHVRATRSRLAASARSVATGQHGAAVEAELQSFVQSRLPDDEWLAALAALQLQPSGQPVAHSFTGLTILALLLMRDTG